MAVLLVKKGIMGKSQFTIMAKHLVRHHFEWIAFSIGIIAMASINPYINSGATWCLFERIGFPFCPGHGLGHSIAFIFRGDFANAIQANIFGPFALVVLLGRIIYLIKRNIFSAITKNIENR